MRLLVTGRSSPIVSCLYDRLRFTQPDLEVRSLGRNARDDIHVDLSDIAEIDAVRAELVAADRVVVSHGLLRPRAFLAQSAQEIQEGIAVNLTSTVRLVEYVLAANPCARVVIVGSESGIKGSFDTTYALAKASLHAYVRWRRLLHPEQQLVCVSPSMLGDGGMTLRREDVSRVAAVARHSPKKRLLLADEVAKWIQFLLFESDGYLCNAVIEIDGGKFAGLEA